jgi:hypothetical protein
MKPLSQSLEEMAGRVKELEDSAVAAFEADRATLEKRAHEIEEEIKTGVGEFESALNQAAEDGRTWWNDTKASMRRPFDELRARVDKRQSEHEVHRAERHAAAAEEDAAAAVGLAAYFLNVAEYAVIDAALARMAADDLAEQTPGTTS